MYFCVPVVYSRASNHTVRNSSLGSFLFLISQLLTAARTVGSKTKGLFPNH